MSDFTGRPLWRLRVFILAGCVAATPSQASGMSLADAQRLAIEQQPLLIAESSQAAAERERAVAARQLPDPQLKLGVQNLPVDTSDAGRFNRDSMTQSTVGLSQEFPPGSKRQLKGEAESLRADAADAQLAAMSRLVQRDAGLAYLELLLPHHASALVRLQIEEARRARGEAEIAYRSGHRGQADLLAADAAIGLLEDKAADFEQAYAVARDNLRRWIGDVPDFEPVDPDLPSLPPLSALLANLDHHPELIAAERSVARAQIGKRLARQAKLPDIFVELDYGYRGDYSDMVSLQVGIPLPLFTHNRQDRDIAAAQSEIEAEQAAHEDLRRRLAAELSGSYRQWDSLGTRVDRYGADVIPALQARVDAALAEYGGGAGSFASVLDARQSLLDAQLALIDLRLRRLRAALQLGYFAMGESHAQ